MALRDQEVFKESGPAPGAENMFADDPEMLEMIGQARERERREGPPRRKPLWWQVFLGVLGIVWGAAVTVPAALELTPFHPVIPATGLFGGMCLALGILGHLPKRYKITDERTGEEEKATLWKQMPILLRLGAILAALVMPAAAYALVFLQ
jgi:hypothetical protein